VVQPGGVGPNSDAQAAALRVQAQSEETKVEKHGSIVLVVGFEALARLGIRADPRKTRDSHPMEEEEVSGFLAEEIPGQEGQADDSEKAHRVHPANIVRSS
jgi:hypothetical protein